MKEKKESNDKFVSTCAVFYEMAHEFLEFVNAYCLGDTVVVEAGYNLHLHRAECLGQNKYVNICLRQNEVLYRDNPYSRLQEWRMNRFGRHYGASTGKRCVAHGKFLEHSNQLCSEFKLRCRRCRLARQHMRCQAQCHH